MSTFTKYFLVSLGFCLFGSYIQMHLSAVGIDIPLAVIGFMTPILYRLTKDDDK